MLDPYVSALAVERVGYLRSGKAGRVALVDQELARLGYECDENGEVKELKKAAKVEKRPSKAPEKRV